MSRVAQLLKIVRPEEIEVVTTSPNTTILEAAFLMKEKSIGALPVIDEGMMVGIISERDLVFKVIVDEAYTAEATVGEYMTKFPEYVTPFTDVMDCLNLMEEKRVRHVPVLDKGKLVGIVSIRDVLYVLLKNQELVAQQFESYILGAR